MFVEKLTDNDKREILVKALNILEKDPDIIKNICHSSKIEEKKSNKETIVSFTFHSFPEGIIEAEKILIDDYTIASTYGSISQVKNLEKMYYQYMCKKFPSYERKYYDQFRNEIVEMYIQSLTSLNKKIKELKGNEDEETK